MFKRSFAIIIFLFLFLSNFIYFHSEDNTIAASENDGDDKEKRIIVNHSLLRDTIYTSKNSFIEINLKEQIAYLHTKDTTFSYKISSGTAGISKGVKTKEGLFAVQSKAVNVRSAQFDNTLLINWVGFNRGIGFHALESKNYYRYLGKRPSSHGCVRISQEDSKHLYKRTEIGTPVLVHSGDCAIAVAFANPKEDYKKLSYDELKKSFLERQEKLYNGTYILSKPEKLIVDNKNIFTDGLPIGFSSKIAEKQELLDYSTINEPALKDITNLPVKLNDSIIVDTSKDSVQLHQALPQ